MDMPSLAELLIPAAQAHEKWFTPLEPVRYAQPEFYRTPNLLTVGAVLAVAAFAAIAAALDRRFERSALYAKLEARIRPFRDYGAGVLAISVAALMIWSAWKGVLLADNFPLQDASGAAVLRAAEALVGALFLIGLFTPAAAVGLMTLYLALFLLFPPAEGLDYLYFGGIAVFLFAFSRGRFSLDWFLGKPIFMSAEHRKRAYLALRLFTGAAFFVLAFGKWARPDLHLSLMDAHASWNPYVILQWFGISMSREVYVFLLFVIESTVALAVAAGFLTRLAAVMLVPIFLGSILFLGVGELVGHLPILGILFVLFVYGDTYHKHLPNEVLASAGGGSEKAGKR